MYKTDRREFVKLTLKAIDEEVPTIVVSPWFDCPYTVVDVECLDWVDEDGQHLQGRGCAKVCHPDPWVTATGQEIATARAVQKIADQLVHDPDAWTPTY